MKHFTSIFVAAVAASSWACPSWAMPTSAPLWGITGTGILPSTDVVPERQLEAGVGYEDVSPGDGRGVRLLPVGSVAYGLRRGEVGGGLLRERVRDPFLGASVGTTYSALHGKYRVYERPGSGVSAAVGAHYLDFGRVSGGVLSAYAVGSKVLTPDSARLRVVANAGALFQRIRGASDDSTLRPYASLEAGRGAYSVALDYAPRSGQSAKLASVAARYQGEKLGFQVGYGKLSSSDDKLFLGATYRFGTGR